MNKKIIAATFTLLSSLASAHPGHSDGFVAAFAHPFTGIDHLLMMLCVGIFAGRIGGHARWQLPLVFLSAMSVGWVLGNRGFAFAGIDSGIAAGLIALGVLFVGRVTLPFALQVCVIASFALLHGVAHGIELASSPASLPGFLLATALLHCVGLRIASLLSLQKQNIFRLLGVLLAIVGGGLLAAV